MFIRMVGMYTVMKTPKRRLPRTTCGDCDKVRSIKKITLHGNAVVTRREVTATTLHQLMMVLNDFENNCGKDLS